MAQIQEEVIVVKLSKLVKHLDPAVSLSDDGFSSTLESVVQELVGADIIVEVEKA